MTITPTHLAPMPTPASLEPEVVGLPSFVQMEQQKATDQAQAEQSAMVLDGKDKKTDDFKGLMPKSMLLLGETYETEQKFNGTNGKLGKFLAQMASVSVLQQSFSKLVSSASSFGALKDYFESNSQWGQAGNGVSAVATSIMNQFRNWSNGDANSGQAQSMQQSELGIMNQEGNSLSQQAQANQAATSKIQSNGADLAKDAGSLGGFLSQMSSGFASLGV